MPRAFGTFEMLRAVKSSPPPPPSPARAALATAIAEHTAAKAKHDALEAAVGRWDGPARVAVRTAEAALEDARASLEQAKQDGATYLVEKSLGDARAPSLSVKDAREAITLAADQLESARQAVETLKARIPDAASALDWAERRLDAATLAVIKESPAPEKLLAEVQTIFDQLFDKATLLLWFLHNETFDMNDVQTGGGTEFSPAARMKHRLQNLNTMHFFDDRPGTLHPALAIWDNALAALKADASAPLPPL